jgi:hypothetical protein
LPGRLEPFRAGAARTLPGLLRTTPAIIRAHAGVRRTPAGDEVAIVTAWATPEAAMAVLGPELGPGREIPGMSEHLASIRIDHYEIDELRVFAEDSAPSMVRIAAGWIELGADAEIQQELRRRLDELGDDVMEACVGRRIGGPNVEVVLVTAWRAQPAGRSLEEPLFPEIAGRYRALQVELYEAIPLRERD